MNSITLSRSVFLLSMISSSCIHPAGSSKPEPEKIGLEKKGHCGTCFEIANIAQSKTNAQSPDSRQSAMLDHTRSFTDQAAHPSQDESFNARTQIISCGQIKVVGAAYNNFVSLSLQDQEDIVNAIIGENLNHIPVISVDRAWPDYIDIVKIVIGDYDLVFVRGADTERFSLYKMQKYFSSDILPRHTIWELQEKGVLTRHYLHTRPFFRANSGKSGGFKSSTNKSESPVGAESPIAKP